MTQKERSRKYYLKAKENGLCQRCHKPLDRDGVYCLDCLEKEREYRRETREFCRRLKICPECRKNALFGDEKICLECAVKRAGYSHPQTEESRRKYGRSLEHNKAKYAERKKNGICTRCGKRHAAVGRVKCAVCLEKDALAHRLRRERCKNCEWYAEYEGVCCNADSPHVADFIGGDGVCEHWERGRLLKGQLPIP